METACAVRLKRSVSLVDRCAVAGEAFEDLLRGLVPHDTKGLGPSFQTAAQALMSAASSFTLQWAERLSFLVVRAEDYRSTMFIHEP